MFSFAVCAFAVISKNLLLSPISQRLISMLSFEFYTLALTKIQLELIFVDGMKQGSNFTLLHTEIQLSQHYLLKRLYSSPLKYLGILDKNKWTIIVYCFCKQKHIDYIQNKIFK